MTIRTSSDIGRLFLVVLRVDLKLLLELLPIAFLRLRLCVNV
jgi:hypothetical protein